MTLVVSPVDRRHADRRLPSPDEPLSRLRLRIGTELSVLDISNSGALVEGVARLGPGARVDVHIVTRHGRVLVRSTVMRAWVCAVRVDAVTYRTALRFDQPVETQRAPG